MEKLAAGNRPHWAIGQFAHRHSLPFQSANVTTSVFAITSRSCAAVTSRQPFAVTLAGEGTSQHHVAAVFRLLFRATAESGLDAVALQPQDHSRLGRCPASPFQ